MARSTYIYVVLDVIPGPPKIWGAYTVKHELVRDLRQLTSDELICMDVYRVNDSGAVKNSAVALDIWELLGD